MKGNDDWVTLGVEQLRYCNPPWSYRWVVQVGWRKVVDSENAGLQ